MINPTLKEHTKLLAIRSSKTTIKNVFRFKDKEVILSSGHKLKVPEVAVREDFSVSIRHARRKVLEFAKQHEAPYKILCDNILVGWSSYI